jgi:ATP synthase protein I
MQQPGALQAKKIIQIQLIFGLMIIVVTFLLRDDLISSVSVGAGVCVMANAVLAAWIFRSYRAQELSQLAARFYWGEATKIAVILSLFALALTLLNNLNLPVMLGAYFTTQVIPTVIAAQFGSRNSL